MTKHNALPVKEENGEPIQHVPLPCSHLKSTHIINHPAVMITDYCLKQYYTVVAFNVTLSQCRSYMKAVLVRSVFYSTSDEKTSLSTEQTSGA